MGIVPRSRLTAYVTLASSKKKEREMNALIVAMLPTEEREKFYDHLSQWVLKYNSVGIIAFGLYI